jgi:2,4-dienoyl-CoA reductase (NADPH2)
VIGAGGIGIDVATYLLAGHGPQPVAEWCAEWGVDLVASAAGGLVPASTAVPRREIWLLQRKPGKEKMGAGPGKTTGWAHRLALRRQGVHMLAGVEYVKVDNSGLHIRVDGAVQVLAVDHVVICAGQVPVRESAAIDANGRAADPRVHVIGGARVAVELDAERAIREGSELGARL